MADSTLTPKQRAFVAAYLRDKNATAAAREAGYSAKTAEQQGSRLLRNAQVKRAVEKALARVEVKAETDAAYVLAGLREVAERCMEHRPKMEFDREAKAMRPVVNADGQYVYEFDSAGANRALELLGKHLALFTDRTMLSNPDGSALGPARVEVVLVKP